MFVLLLQAKLSLKTYSFFYNDHQYTISYVHDMADQVESGTLYNDFPEVPAGGYMALVAYASTLRDTVIKVDTAKATKAALFGVGDFTLVNSTIEFELLAKDMQFAISVFGRGIIELVNGTLAVRGGMESEFRAAFVGENLAFMSENFILNFTALTLAEFEFFDTVTYISCTNITFTGAKLAESNFYQAGKRAFACPTDLMNCSTCKQHYYLEGKYCVPILQVGMNCNGCIRGYVNGLEFGSIDDSKGCYKKVESKRGENCYFGFATDSTTENPKFAFRCARCFDSNMDPTKGCEVPHPSPDE